MADELVHRTAFDREVWRAGDALYLVQRPRFGPVTRMAVWGSLGGFALLTAVLVLGFAIARPDWTAGWVVGALFAGLGVLGLAALRNAWRDDRAAKRRPFRELPHVAIADGRVAATDGPSCAIADARLVEEIDDTEDARRYVLWLKFADRDVRAFETTDAGGLAPVIATLEAAGLSRAPSR